MSSDFKPAKTDEFKLWKHHEVLHLPVGLREPWKTSFHAEDVHEADPPYFDSGPDGTQQGLREEASDA